MGDSRSEEKMGYKSGDMKRRKFAKNNHYSLSDVGTSIMKQNEYPRNSLVKEDLNRSMQPGSYYLKQKVIGLQSDHLFK